MNTSLIFPVLFLVFFGVVMVLSAVASMKQKKSWKQYPQSNTNTQKARYGQTQTPQQPQYRYAPEGFSNQMELDIRLPYRQYKMLHPETELDYERYKQMQMRNAFKRSISSQQNKRMVR